ncbi:MAG: type 4a pilus biogenesis protein PilO [Patescibacteria group bacterium]
MPNQEFNFSSFSFKADIKKQIIFGSLLVVFLLGINLFFYLKIKSANQELIRLRQEVVKTQQLFANFSALKIQQKEAEPILAILEKVLPAKQGVLKSVVKIQEVAQKNSLQQSFSFGQEYRPESGAVGNIGFNLVLNGPISSFAKYLKDLEALPPFIQFGYIEIARKDGSYQFNSTGKIYMR